MRFFIYMALAIGLWPVNLLVEHEGWSVLILAVQLCALGAQIEYVISNKDTM